MVERLTTAQACAQRLAVGAGIVAMVLAAHGCVAGRLEQHFATLDATRDLPKRMTVTYVREMAPIAPTLVAKPVVKAPKVKPGAGAAAASASMPEKAVDPEPGSLASPPVAPLSPQAPASASIETVPMTEAASAAQGASSPTPVFEWPASTRLRYVLTGHVQGEVHGQAQVEWIRSGNRYQVHLDLSVGPSIAPLVSRRLSSDGEITAEGLLPRVYDQETKLAFNAPNRAVVRFDDDYVHLANGQRVPRAPGSQDTASQFVQMSWMFAVDPQRLKVGQSIALPLAMPRNLSVWIYDVAAEETLYTPFGELQTFHLKPRRVARAGGDLTSELWIAPQLRYLPVRFVIRQDAETYIDLMLIKKPEVAAN